MRFQLGRVLCLCFQVFINFCIYCTFEICFELSISKYKMSTLSFSFLDILLLKHFIEFCFKTKQSSINASSKVFSSQNCFSETFQKILSELEPRRL